MAPNRKAVDPNTNPTGTNPRIISVDHVQDLGTVVPTVTKRGDIRNEVESNFRYYKQMTLKRLGTVLYEK